MKWDSHISSIVAKANSTLGFIRRNLKYAPLKLKCNAYTSLVRSKLEYSAVIWDPYLKKDISKLEQVQRRAARFICNDYRRDSSVTAMLERLDLPTLTQRRMEKRLQFMNKIVSGSIAIPADQYLQPGSRRTRSANANKFQTVRANTEEYRNSFIPRTIVDWNRCTQAEIDRFDSTSHAV